MFTLTQLIRLGGRPRGELTPLPKCITLVDLIKEAYAYGASLYKACAKVALSKRTYWRWYRASESHRYQVTRRSYANVNNELSSTRSNRND